MIESQGGGDKLHLHQTQNIVTEAFNKKYAKVKEKPKRTLPELVVEFNLELELATEEYRQVNLDTLRKNAINDKHKLADIEVKFVTQEEYETLLEASKPEPTETELYEAKVKAKEAEILRGMAIAEIEADKTVELTK